MAKRKSKLNVEWMPRSLEDLFEIAQYAHEQASSEAAEMLLASLHATGEALAPHPHLWRVRSELRMKDVRFAPTEAYFICYRIVNVDIQILRVIHKRRDIAALFAQIEEDIL